MQVARGPDAVERGEAEGERRRRAHGLPAATLEQQQDRERHDEVDGERMGQRGRRQRESGESRPRRSRAARQPAGEVERPREQQPEQGLAQHVDVHRDEVRAQRGQRGCREREALGQHEPSDQEDQQDGQRAEERLGSQDRRQVVGTRRVAEEGQQEEGIPGRADCIGQGRHGRPDRKGVRARVDALLAQVVGVEHVVLRVGADRRQHVGAGDGLEAERQGDEQDRDQGERDARAHGAQCARFRPPPPHAPPKLEAAPARSRAARGPRPRPRGARVGALPALASGQGASCARAPPLPGDVMAIRVALHHRTRYALRPPRVALAAA